MSQIKVAFIGQGGAGKTSLLMRIINNSFDSSINSTIGVNNFVLDVNFDDKVFHLILYDTAGQEIYGEVADFYLKNVDIIVVCFDPVLVQAEKSLLFWKEIANKFLPKNRQILVSTKADLWSEKNPLPSLVQKEDALPNKYGTFSYIRTSSVSGLNIGDLKNEICSVFVQNQINKSETNPNIVNLENAENNEKKCSC